MKIRDYQNCCVLCSTVVHNDTRIREQFVKLTFDLGLAVCVFLCFSFNYFVHALFMVALCNRETIYIFML